MITISDEYENGHEIYKAHWNKNDIKFLKDTIKEHFDNVHILYANGRIIDPYTDKNCKNKLNIIIHGGINDIVYYASMFKLYKRIHIGKNPITKATITLDNPIGFNVVRDYAKNRIPQSSLYHYITKDDKILFSYEPTHNNICIPIKIGKEYNRFSVENGLFVKTYAQYKKEDKLSDDQKELIRFIFAQIKPFIKHSKIIHKEKKERFKKSIELSKKLPFIDKIIKPNEELPECLKNEICYYFKEPNPHYIFITKPLTATLPTTKNSEPIKKKIGRYAIVMSPQALITIISLDKHPLFRYQHPHISKINVCLGDYNGLVKTSLANRSINATLNILYRFLTKLTGYSEYISHPKWFKYFQMSPEELEGAPEQCLYVESSEDLEYLNKYGEKALIKKILEERR